MLDEFIREIDLLVEERNRAAAEAPASE
jgi:hypothetical protein